MLTLDRITYLRLGTPDLESTSNYAREILGLQCVERTARETYWRSDDRHHTLAYTEGDPGRQAIGFEVPFETDLDAIAGRVEDAGYRVERGTPGESEQRHCEGFIRFDDPTGNTIELALRPHESPRRYFPGRDAGITGFSHIGLRTTDPKRDEHFWTTVCGARVSDWIGDAPLLRINNPVHHSLALFPSTFAGVQHVNHQVESIDDVMRSYYFLREKGVPIRFGPGRHATSGAVFLYFAGPDGMTYEYSCGVKMIEDEASYRPRQFPFTPESFCLWGSKPDIPEFRKESEPALVAVG